MCEETVGNILEPRHQMAAILVRKEINESFKYLKWMFWDNLQVTAQQRVNTFLERDHLLLYEDKAESLWETT